ncbi:Uncharacterized protein Fot_54420 [Forsythia ovata]|uniref:Uncharacterized protein n=1 Tax=Forsythia ovata TaxID=205694 RepID=A0ABD1P722_9LAMI
MSSKADLARIGKEGFAILDAYKGKKTRPNPQKPYVPQEPTPACLFQYQPQQARVYQVKPEEIMNCYEVLQFHEGVMSRPVFSWADTGLGLTGPRPSPVLRIGDCFVVSNGLVSLN